VYTEYCALAAVNVQSQSWWASEERQSNSHLELESDHGWGSSKTSSLWKAVTSRPIHVDLTNQRAKFDPQTGCDKYLIPCSSHISYTNRKLNRTLVSGINNNKYQQSS